MLDTGKGKNTPGHETRAFAAYGIGHDMCVKLMTQRYNTGLVLTELRSTNEAVLRNFQR